MKKHHDFNNPIWLLQKLLRIMKLTCILILVFVLGTKAACFSQSGKLNLNLKNGTLVKALEQIEDQSEYYFYYNNDEIRNVTNISIKADNGKIEDVLKELLSGTGLTYKVVDRFIVVKKSEDPVNGHQDQQQKNVTGKVTDSFGAALPGVTVVIKGTTQGTITDVNGNYSISNVLVDGTLVFSFVGMKTQEIAISGKTIINTVLEEEAIGVDEVIVVGYGSQKRRDVTGAIASVKTENLEDLPVGTFAQKIQGKLPGVQINQTTGRPGQGMSIRIRGAASINAGNSPLIVVDGAPITGGINNINPDEIESITALKDASASSLYGARAANGVLLITTKQAKAGQSKFEFNAYYGIGKIPESARPDMMNAYEFATYMKWRYEDKARYEGYSGGIPVEYQNPEQYKGKGTDWFDVLLRNAPVESYNLTLSSGSNKSLTSLMAGYYHQEGIVHNTGYRLGSLRLNHETKINDWLKIGFNVAPSLTLEHNTRTTAQTDGYRETILGSMLTSPIAPAVNPDGSLPLNATSPGLFNSVNWYRKLLETKDNWKTLRLLANAFAELSFAKHFTYKFQANTDMDMAVRNYFLPSTAVGSFNVSPPGNAVATHESENYYSWLLENTLNYNQQIGDHSIEALAGYSVQEYKFDEGVATGNTFADDLIPFVSSAAIRDGSSTATDWSMLSMFGRLNYNFMNKYFLSGTIRRDGSSRFGANKKYGLFPSIGINWVVSEESFMKNIPVLNFFKIRASYGLTGNNNIGNYPSIAAVVSNNAVSYVFNNALISGAAISGLGNTLLSWEKTKKFNVGTDIGLLDNRITLSYDYYYHLTDGLLFQIDVPRSSGYNDIDSNIGTFSFWGHELAVSSKNLNGTLKWNTDFNISFNRSLVKKLGLNNLPAGTNSYSSEHLITVGGPVGQLWGFIYEGIYKNQEEFEKYPKEVTSQVGSARMRDIGGPDGVPDGKIDINDRTMIGDPNPDFIFGLSNEFAYKNFDLNIILSGAIGGKILDHTKESTLLLDGLFNMDKSLLNLWRSEENPGNGKVPRSLTSTTNLYRSNHTGWLYSASHLTAKNISLGYTLGTLNNPYIKKMRIYVSVQQAFSIAAYRNPEVSSGGLNGITQGVDFGSYPIPRTFSVGINLSL
jgi:TonB-linked SusC/RagA family outer membrane protein